MRRVLGAFGLTLLALPWAWAAPANTSLGTMPPTPIAAKSARGGAATPSMPAAVASAVATTCSAAVTPQKCVPTTPTYWKTMQLSAQGVSTLERLEGWSNQNNPAKGEIPGVCYDDSGGHGTVGYGHEYPGGHSCAWYMNHPNDPHSHQYNSFKQSPLIEGSPAAMQLLESDVQTKAIAPINQQVHVQLTQQQFDALVIWTFNVGGGDYNNPKIPVVQRGGLAASAALQSMNTCQMNAVPSNFTHYDHANGNVSCGLYRRDMVSGEIWVSGAYTVPRDAFPCTKGSAH